MARVGKKLTGKCLDVSSGARLQFYEYRRKRLHDSTQAGDCSLQDHRRKFTVVPHQHYRVVDEIGHGGRSFSSGKFSHMLAL